MNLNKNADISVFLRKEGKDISYKFPWNSPLHKTSLTKIAKQCSDTEYELAAMRKRVNEQRDEIYELYELQDRLEQYARKSYLEIHKKRKGRLIAG